jgi:TPR repeat protein
MHRVIVLILALTVASAMPDAVAAQSDRGGIRRTTDLPTAELRQLRRRMNAGAELSVAGLRALADAGDSLAAFRFGKRLEERGDVTLLPDALHYYAIATFHGRDFAIPRLIRLLDIYGPDLSKGRLANVLNALESRARRGNVKAAFALYRLQTEGKVMPADPQAARDWLQIAADQGDGDAALRLGIAWMTPTTGLPADPVRARAALELALDDDDLAARVTAENLLRQLDARTAPKATMTEVTQ